MSQENKTAYRTDFFASLGFKVEWLGPWFGGWSKTLDENIGREILISDDETTGDWEKSKGLPIEGSDIVVCYYIEEGTPEGHTTIKRASYADEASFFAAVAAAVKVYEEKAK